MAPKKRVLSLALFLAVASALVLAPVSANAISINIDGTRVQFADSAINENGFVLVPMRELFEALGAEVHWVGPDDAEHPADPIELTYQIIL